MAIPKKEDKKYTYADYLAWPAEESWEIIEGIAYNMSPAPSREHQRISLAFELEIGNFLVNKSCELYHAPFDVRLPVNTEDKENIYNVVQPDIVVVCDKNKLDDAGCIGAPEFIIEILSESTAGKDMKEKLFLYEEYGVNEYWIVDYWDKTVKVYILDSSGKYKQPVLYSSGILESNVLKGLEIKLSKIF